MSTQTLKRPMNRQAFNIGIICALSLEADMVEMVFDKRWDKEGMDYGRTPNDPNTYSTGLIAGRNVVLAYCPGMGSSSAAQVATWLMSSFTGVKIVLLVGICGAVPFYRQEEKKEIWLGDCIISTAVVQFDFGRKGPNSFVQKDGLDALGRASPPIRAMMAKLQTQTNRLDLKKDLLSHLQVLQTKDPERTSYPGATEDRLYQSTDMHAHPGNESCNRCNVELGICDQSCEDLGCRDRYSDHRQRLENNSSPSIHFGYFGSSNTVLKSGLDRDKLADKIIAFEMEGSGVWDICPTIVIKAACDYADSHKNKKWQRYSAAVAAAGLKSLLPKLQFLDQQNPSINTPCSVEDGQRPAKPIYMVPFLRNRRFTGREGKLQGLEDQLLINNECRQLAVYGLGGVGKTQLALEFCYIVKEKYTDCSIFWVSALSEARFKQDFAKIAQKYNIGVGRGEDELAQIVQEHMNSEKAGRWLLVVDNADNKTVLFDDKNGIMRRLPQSDAGITLFTTRYKDTAADLTDGDILSLEGIDLVEAKLLLQKFLRRDVSIQDEKAVENLLEELAYLPIAISQASSYIIKKSITISKYLNLMMSCEKEMVKLLSYGFGSNPLIKETRNAVAVTWLVSFELIRSEEPKAADILFLLAPLENKAIPRSILPQTDFETDLTDAIGTLVGYSFLTEQRNKETYDMHRLVHLALKIWMQKEGVYDEWQKKTVSHIASIFPSGHWENRTLWQQYTTHAIRVLRDTEPMATWQRANLCLKLGSCLEEDGRISEALWWISEGALWAGQSLSEDDTLRLTAQGLLAGVYIKNGQIKEAVNILEKVVAIKTRVLAEDHPSRLASQHELAIAYRSNGQIKGAVNILEKVAAIRTRVLAEDHPSRLASQHELARAYQSNGQIKKAINILEKVVTTEARVLAEDHPDRLVSQHALAIAYESGAQLNKAISLMQHVVKVQETSLRTDHPDRLLAESELSQMLIQVAGRNSSTTEGSQRSVEKRISSLWLVLKRMRR